MCNVSGSPMYVCMYVAVYIEQGDRMSLWKNSQPIFCQKLNQFLFLGGKCGLLTYVYNSQKTAQVSNRPLARKFAKSGHPEV
jgi:hypothetical protein